MSERPWPTVREWLDGSAGENIADVLAQGRRGRQLLEFYEQDVRETVTAASGEVTAVALAGGDPARATVARSNAANIGAGAPR